MSRITRADGVGEGAASIYFKLEVEARGMISANIYSIGARFKGLSSIGIVQQVRVIFSF